MKRSKDKRSNLALLQKIGRRSSLGVISEICKLDIIMISRSEEICKIPGQLPGSTSLPVTSAAHKLAWTNLVFAAQSL